MTSAALTAPQTTPRPRIGTWAAAQAPALIALLVFAATLWPTAMLNDADTWWHLSAGDWIVAHRTVPHADPFSWTFAGKPWIAHEWLSEILMSLAFALAGWPGLMVLTALATALATFLLARGAARSLGGLPLVLLVLGGGALFAPHLLARPHMLVAPVMILWFSALARHDGTPPWRILPLMTLWANMHGSFIAGLVLAGPFALEAVLASANRPRTAWLWTGFIVAGLACALITPFGLDGLLFPLRLLTMPGVDGIGEWSPIDFTKPQPLLIAVLGFAAFWLMRRPRLPIVRVLTLGCLLAAAVHQQRHEMLLGLIAVLVLAEPIAGALSQPQPAVPSRPPLVLAAAVLGLAALRLVIPLAEPVNARDPAAAIAYARSAAPHGRVLNDYSYGGYLIRAGIAPYIDSRADMYGPAALDRYSAIANDPAALKTELNRDAIAWTMLKPGSIDARLMDTLPGWRRAYADSTAVIHVRAVTGR